MIQFDNGGILVKRIADIPEAFIGAARIYLDAETSSGSPTEMSVNPWRHCSMLGWGVTVDDCPNAYYADARYTEDFWTQGPTFIQNLVWRAQTWVNHNIKYDMHVFHNHYGISYPKWLKFKCTIVAAKLVDSDRGGARGGYSLDALSLNWLKHDIRPYEEKLQCYLGRGNKDYGRIPADIIAEYGCQDSLTERNLDNYIERRLPERSRRVAATEIEVTRHLYTLEQNGMNFDETEMRLAQLHSLNRMATLDAELAAITGTSFRPAVSEDCSQILCGIYGLPVVRYTKDSESGEDTENASFDKAALTLYTAMPYAPHDVISKIKEYRQHSQRNSLFYNPLLAANWNGCIHPTYNQVVRTGRMSCGDPNAQQFDATIVGLIRPKTGYSIISTDASQIEKRLVVHYIQDKSAIAAYQHDPDTDFYQLTADMCGISRQAAKAVDLGTGYGEGEKKLVAALRSNPDVVKAVKAQVQAMNLESDAARQAAFDQLADARGKMIYKAYHERYPSLKVTAKKAEAAVKSIERRLGLASDSNHYYGYITNLYGRDRHIPYAKYRTDFKTKDSYDRAWLAFPTLNQSTAADLMKERFVAVMESIGDADIRPLGLVHDELVFTAPTEIARDSRTARDMLSILESPAVKIDVPIRWAWGVSEKNWLDAAEKVKDGGQSTMLQVDKASAQNFDWLR